MDLIPEFTATDAVNDDQLGLVIRNSGVVPFFKFFQLQVQDLAVCQVFPLVGKFFDVQVHHRAGWLQVLPNVF